MPKNIAIFCDGTGQEYGKNNTNVVELYSVTKKLKNQRAFYDPGVGTGGWEYDDEDGINLQAKADQATGKGLQKNVNDAYRILMSTYEPGDSVFLFGFSRGAFTVRSLSGMLHKVGLLHSDQENLVEYAAELYNQKDNEEIAEGFKETFSRKCPIHFIGVWDTVDSLVLNAGARFHNPQVTPETTNAVQALSIDEQRNDFPPSIWDEDAARADQHIEQVWFAGVHSDVGGGYPERGLANCSLLWMLDKARSCGLTTKGRLPGPYNPDPLDTLHESYKGIWLVRGWHTRQIPEGARIHRSVEKRLDSTEYQPNNLPARDTLSIIDDAFT